MNIPNKKKSKGLVIGGVIAVVLFFLLRSVGLVIISPGLVSPPIYILINALCFLFSWWLLAFLIHKYPLYKVLIVVGLLIGATVADMIMQIPDNPITIPLAILFWLGAAYLILPDFFGKYKLAILSVYGLILSYFFIFRMMPNYIEDHRHTFLSLLLSPIPVFIGLWIYEQWRHMRALKVDKVKAELALLKSQINPHFFFNTLNNLYGLVVERSEEAPDVVLKLSDMMRYTIYEGKEDLVLLKNEINYLKNYIELHKIRYQKKVEISFTHAVQEDQKIAPLLFIILLENAFKHGVEKMRKNAFIHLDMQSRGEELIFTIENNYEESVSDAQQGIGLDNLKKRLDFLYPDRHQLIIHKTQSNYKVQLNITLT